MQGEKKEMQNTSNFAKDFPQTAETTKNHILILAILLDNHDHKFAQYNTILV